MTERSVIIGIAGASASGKSLLANTLYQELKQDLGSSQIGQIKEDYYYKDLRGLTMEERERTNYDHPDAYDHALLLQHLRELQQGNLVELPQYCFQSHTRKTTTKPLSPKKVIILEGILLLAVAAIRAQLHASIFMDTPLDICLLRRLSRDVSDRGRTMESVLEQYQQTVRPMYLQYIEPSRQYADVIIPRGGKNRIAIDMLKAKIRQLVTINERSPTCAIQPYTLME
jgi:uridine kinase